MVQLSTNTHFQKVLRYLWDSEPPNTDHVNEIVCLGCTYSPLNGPEGTGNGNASDRLVQSPPDISESEKGLESSIEDLNNYTTNTPIDKGSNPSDETPWPQDFLQDVDSKIWLTYRTNFPVIPKSKHGPSAIRLGSLLRGSGLELGGFTSDVGWGCMIRTGQSLLANALQIQDLGRDWRRCCSDDKSQVEELKLMSLFRDNPEAPFSLHNFVKHGEDKCGKMPGEWFGPSAAASSIKALCNTWGKDFQVYLSEGSDVYENQFLSTANHLDKDSGQEIFRPTLILLGIRLGIDRVNPVYWNSLKEFLSVPQAVGIAGGRPSSSHYFFGYQGESLFYLDPHYPRPLLEFADNGEFDQIAIDSVHTKRIRTLHLKEMDPSMLVGFVIKDRNDWVSWKNHINQSTNRHIIHISDREPTILRRTSVSIGSDDDGEFVDVGLESQEELRELQEDLRATPVLVDRVIEQPEESRQSHSYDEPYSELQNAQPIAQTPESESRFSQEGDDEGLVMVPSNSVELEQDENDINEFDENDEDDEEEPVNLGSECSYQPDEEWEEMDVNVKSTIAKPSDILQAPEEITMDLGSA